MSQNEIHTKASFPFGVILVTVILTLVISGGLAYYMGYLGPVSGSNLADTVSKTDHKHDSKEPLYSCGMHPWIIVKEPGNCPICGMKLTPKRDKQEAPSATTERKIAYWRAPMNPTEIYDKAGKSAMGMDLVPVYDDEVLGGVEIKIDPVTQQNMGIRTALVEKGPLGHTIRTYGHITYDETRTAQINPKFSGWFEKLYVDFTGQLVKKGERLFEIYSPELITAQEEYLEAYKNHSHYPGQRGKEMLASVRQRLKYFDIANTEIRKLEKSGKVKRTLAIHSPFKGVVTHKNAVEGGYVKAGTTVYEIADLSTVWVEAHIYEYELHRVSIGQEAQMTLPYWPGKIFTGKVAFIYPYLQQKTRDVVIRLEFKNPDLELKPEMYSDVRIKTIVKNEGLLIPSEGVIRSGERNVVFVTRENNKFSPREVTLGITMDDGKIHIKSGLAPGETVVTSGQFLLDSESKLKEAVQKMLEAKKGGTKPSEKPKDDFFDDMGSEDNFFNDMESDS